MVKYKSISLRRLFVKTTVEIPDDLFRQVKARAALEGLPLRDLVTYGLRLALQAPPQSAHSRRATFPLIHATPGASPLTDADVSEALAEMGDVEARCHADAVGR
jgi:hypothetical protein